MKQQLKGFFDFIAILLMLALLYFWCGSCSSERNEESPDEILQKLKPPIIVLSRGSMMGDTRIKVIDSNHKIVTFVDNSLDQINRGDTLILK
jgi:hypothetical protein